MGIEIADDGIVRTSGEALDTAAIDGPDLPPESTRSFAEFFDAITSNVSQVLHGKD